MSAVANGKKEKAKLFEMVLSSPGMQEQCKVNLNLTRQNVLVLCRLLETGLADEKKLVDDDFLSSLPEAVSSEFKTLSEEILRKSGLTDFYEKLKAL